MCVCVCVCGWINGWILFQVYVSLCCAYIAAETAAYLHHLGKIAVLLTSFICLGCLAWLFYTPSYEKVHPKELSSELCFLLIIFSLGSSGCSELTSSLCFSISSETGSVGSLHFHLSMGLHLVPSLCGPWRLIQGTS